MDKPNFFAIIPATVRYDSRLKGDEKILYGEITALASKEGYCWASNDYFAELYGVHKNTVSVWINHLKECKHLDTIIDKLGNRKIYIVKTPQPNQVDPLPETRDTPSLESGNIVLNTNNKKNKASGEASLLGENFDTWLEQYTKTEIYAGEDSGMVEGWLVPGRKRPCTLEEMAKRYKAHLKTQTPSGGANRGQLEDSSDRFFDVYASVLENRYGQRPLIGWSTKQLVKKHLLDKHPKEFVREYMQWVMDTDSIEKEWKYNLKALCSESNINKFIASK